ncbi:putative CRM domain-containing protein At3g25440, chloroplastic [Curcuma longa]|uniref:putative CRM domain-containing protein At3g25440, chloroplastic n=1 Tax=Curcuma longa TaxID=136217 RepID=UPI003D9E9696
MISAFRRLAKSERIGWFHGLISPCGRSRIPLFDRTSYSLKRFGNGNYLKAGTSYIWNDICISHFSSCAFSSRWSVTSLVYHNTIRWQSVRFRSDSLVTLNTDNHVARFSIGRPNVKNEANSKAMKKPQKKKMSRKAKLNELKWFRLKAKKKMKSPNPEVRIRYKLEKAKRKEVWLIEKLRKYEIPKAPLPVHDPEILTEEEKFYLKRTGEKKKNYVPVGRRGLFGGVVLNMHMHWKKHETVKVVCKPCKPGQIHEYAEELERLSKGTVIDIKAKNTIIFYRGKNYVQPDIMSPPDTLSKHKALEKYKFEQSLEHTSQFIEKLERQLEEYHKYVELYKKNKDMATERTTANEECSAD